jgi:CRP/FNR family transcriptional regulator, cyclic AMP receptor protein
LSCRAGRGTDGIASSNGTMEGMAIDAQSELVDLLARLALFADLSRPQLERVAHTFDEAVFPDGQRILRQGFQGTGFYVILDGEVAIRVDGEDRARLGRGDFFGEVSILLGEPPVADVVALGPLRCLQLGGSEVERFLLDHPPVMYRMLQAQARRLRNANRWRS